MEGNGAEHIWIISSVGSQAEESRPMRGGLAARLAEKGLNAVSVEALKHNVTRFLSQLHDILDTDASRIGAFEIAEVEVAAQITAGGEICLLGSGGKMEVEGGLKFVLKRTGK